MAARQPQNLRAPIPVSRDVDFFNRYDAETRRGHGGSSRAVPEEIPRSTDPNPGTRRCREFDTGSWGESPVQLLQHDAATHLAGRRPHGGRPGRQASKEPPTRRRWKCSMSLNGTAMPWSRPRPTLGSSLSIMGNPHCSSCETIQHLPWLMASTPSCSHSTIRSVIQPACPADKTVRLGLIARGRGQRPSPGWSASGQVG